MDGWNTCKKSKRNGRYCGRAVQGVWFLRRVLSNKVFGTFRSVQLKGISSSSACAEG